jgi:hypothetical protein
MWPSNNGIILKSIAEVNKFFANTPNFGCQIFLDTIYQNGDIYQITKEVPNTPKVYQMVVKFSKWPYHMYTNIFHSTM